MPIDRVTGGSGAHRRQAMGGRTLSAPEHYLTMTRSLLANSNADYGCLFLSSGTGLRPTAVGYAHHGRIAARLLKDSLPSYVRWPKTAVSKADQSRAAVVFARGNVGSPYDGDEYFSATDTKSCICVPLVSKNAYFGIVYLERARDARGFETTEQQCIEFLVRQVADYLQLNASLMAERNLLRTVIDAIPDLVFVKDTDSRFVVANAAMVEAFGLTSADQLIGKSDFDFYPAEKLMHIYADEQNIMQSGVAHLDHHEQNISHFESPRWFSTTKVPVRNESNVVVGLVGCCREITQHKLHELDLERRNDELAVLNAKLTHAQEQLIRAEKMAALGSLVAGVAHELNTPIGIGLTVASTLLDQTRALLTDVSAGGLRKSTLEQYLGSAERGTELLLTALSNAGELVSNFKQVAVDQSSSKRRKFALRQVLEEILSTLSPIINATPFVLELALEEELALDSFPGPMGQVINNLVSNAMVHGLEGRPRGTMRLSARGLDAEHLEIRFEDDGVGIPEKNLTRVFDPFFTTRLGKGGSGLGLNIVYNIVTGVLGGSIHVDSLPGAGTRVTIKMPFVAPTLSAVPDGG